MNRSLRRITGGVRPDLLDAWLYTVPLIRPGPPAVVPYHERLFRLERLAPAVFTPLERRFYAVRLFTRQGRLPERWRHN